MTLEMWESVTLGVVRYMRAKKQAPLADKGAKERLIELYTRLPSHHNFTKVKREGFVEKTPAVRGSRKAKKAKTQSQVPINLRYHF